MGFVLAILATMHSPPAAMSQGVIVGSSGDGVRTADTGGTAQLNTNPDQERLIQRADQLAREGRYDLAAVLWQRVLDDSGSTLMTRDGWQTETFDGDRYRRYKSVAAELQSVIARLPAEGLRVYRLSADAEARTILAAAPPEKREQALAEVVRRYFLSSVGDTAAMELACRALDRHDFVGAVRMLNQIDTLYPNPSVSRGDVLLRLALANARMGDRRGAEAALGRLESLSGSRPSDRLIDMVRKDAGGIASDPAEIVGRTNWTQQLGTPARTGRMAGLPAAIAGSEMSCAWFDDEVFDATAETSTDRQAIRGMPYGYPAPMLGMSRDQILERWKQYGWTPSGQLLIQAGRAYYTIEDKVDNKIQQRLVCRDIATGKLKWLGCSDNSYEPVLPPIYQVYGFGGAYQMQQRQPALPSSPAEIRFFGDRVRPAMSIAGDRLLVLEGPPALPDKEAASRPRNFFDFRAVGLGRQRDNRLSAYDTLGGKWMWTRTATDDKHAADTPTTACFLAAPVALAQQLLLPLVDNGTLWLISLDRNTGKTLWKSMLCDEPEAGCSAWAPVGTAVEGGEVYVATGAGVVAALDATSGNIYWMVQYPRKRFDHGARRFISQSMPTQSGCWDEDVVIARGRSLIVLPSDSDQILALDRRTGEVLWRSERAPPKEERAASTEVRVPPADPVPVSADYCLGVLGDYLYVAGRKIVRCYKIGGGKLEWEHGLSNSLGRGMLTDDAIYVPDGDAIVRLDPRPERQSPQQRELTRSRVVTSAGEPLGNLYCDGDRILVHGLSRVYVLESLDKRMSYLTDRISRGSDGARRERMKLYRQMGNDVAALAELREIYVAARRKSGLKAATSELFSGIDQLELVSRRPLAAIELMVAAERDAAVTNAIGSVSCELQRRQRAAVLFAALDSLQRERTRIALPVLLSSAELCREEHLMERLCKLVLYSARPSDLPALTEATSHANASVRRAAAAGLGAIQNPKAQAALAGLLPDRVESVQLEAATEMANQGLFPALPTLVKLLDSAESGIRSQAFSTLRSLTGQEFDYDPQAAPEERAKAVAAWRQWIATAGATAKLSFPIRPPGRILLGCRELNQVIELGLDGQETWRMQVPAPYGVQGLPNGHRLVASYAKRSIHEFDADGKEVWTVTGLSGWPTCVERLRNGNTLVVMGSNGEIVEIAPDKKVVSSHFHDGVDGLAFATRLDNGNTLVCLRRQDRVAELDPQEKEVASYPAPSVSSAHRLKNGNTLICEEGFGRVVELDRAGKIKWSLGGMIYPLDALRLANGDTVVSQKDNVQRFDSSGRLVQTWKFPLVYHLSAF